MTDEELSELLGLVDEPVEDVPAAFERRLWDELSTTFDNASTSDTAASEAHNGTTTPIVFAPVDDAPDDRTRWTQWGSLVAAVAAVVVIGLVWARSGGEPTVVTGPDTTPAPTVTASTAPTTPPADSLVDATAPSEATTPPVLLDPVEACERYRTGAAPLIDLPDELAALPTTATADALDVVVDDIEGVRLAMVTYATDLAAGDFIGEAEVREFTNVSRTLGQALVEIDSGDLDAALRSVDAARSAASNLLQTLELPGLRYDALGPTIDCVE